MMFDFDTCNHMARFLLTDDGIEDPRPHHFLIQVAMEYL
jgi:hypothetical protein